MMDLQPDRSLVRRLLEQGLDVYLIDWGNPDGADRLLELDDYINGYIDRCVRHVLARARHAASSNLLGVCQGGTFSLCYTALHPERVRNLITMVTPVDFHTPDNLLSRWVQGLDVDALVEAFGIVPGELLNNAYVALMPFRLLQQKYVHLLDGTLDAAQAENFMRMEKWIFDSPGQAGAAFGQFVALDVPGEPPGGAARSSSAGGASISGGSASRCSTSTAGRTTSCRPRRPSRSGAWSAASDYTALALDLGHIGMYVSARAQREVPGASPAGCRRAPISARRTAVSRARIARGVLAGTKPAAALPSAAAPPAAALSGPPATAARSATTSPCRSRRCCRKSSGVSASWRPCHGQQRCRRLGCAAR